MNKSIYILILSIVAFVSCTKNETPSNGSFQGNIDVVKTFGGTKNESANSVVPTNDGGYAVFGFTQSNDGDVTNKSTIDYDYWLLKFDAANQLQWTKTFGGSDDDRGQSIIQTLDGGFFITGYSKSNDGDIGQNFGANDFWLIKLDASGNIVWEKSHGFSGIDIAYNAIQTNDGGYLITGILDVSASNQQGNDKGWFSNRHAGGDFWVIKLDANGDKVWRRFFGGTNTDTAYDIVQTNDNGFIILGTSDSFDVDVQNNKGTYDYWAIKIDSAGLLVWEKSFGGNEIDQAYAITSSSDGNFIIVGDARSNNGDVSSNYGSADVWAIKINSSGNKIWEKNYGGSSFETAKDIIASQNGGYYIVGNSRSSNNDLTTNKGNNDIWVFKINENGNLTWEKSIGGTEIDLANSIAELNNGNIIIAGESWSPNNDIPENKGFSDLLIINIK